MDLSRRRLSDSSFGFVCKAKGCFRWCGVVKDEQFFEQKVKINKHTMLRRRDGAIDDLWIAVFVAVDNPRSLPSVRWWRHRRDRFVDGDDEKEVDDRITVIVADVDFLDRKSVV